MKKLFWSALVSVFLFYGLSRVLSRENKFGIVFRSTDAIERNIATYFPFYKNKIYIYKTTDLNSGIVTETVETYPLYVNDDKMQCVTKQTIFNEFGEKTDSYIFSVLYQNINGYLKCFYSDEHASPFENFTEKNLHGQQNIVFKEPLKTGTFFVSDNLTKRKILITDTDLKIDTSCGVFENVIEVIDNTYSEPKQKVYYAPGVGVIKHVVMYQNYWENHDSRTFSTELSQIVENSTFDTEHIVYVVNTDTKELSQKKFILKLSTNDNINQKIMDIIKENKLITPNTRINKFKIMNGEDRILDIYFNNEFPNSEEPYQSNKNSILRAIANTFGQIYNVSKVNITVDGDNSQIIPIEKSK